MTLYVPSAAHFFCHLLSISLKLYSILFYNNNARIFWTETEFADLSESHEGITEIVAAAKGYGSPSVGVFEAGNLLPCLLGLFCKPVGIGFLFEGADKDVISALDGVEQFHVIVGNADLQEACFLSYITYNSFFYCFRLYLRLFRDRFGGRLCRRFRFISSGSPRADVRARNSDSRRTRRARFHD